MSLACGLILYSVSGYMCKPVMSPSISKDIYIYIYIQGIHISQDHVIISNLGLEPHF
jgi:hypothetical protein